MQPDLWKLKDSSNKSYSNYILIEIIVITNILIKLLVIKYEPEGVILTW